MDTLAWPTLGLTARKGVTLHHPSWLYMWVRDDVGFHVGL